jgi:hypothetical protein
MVSQLLCLRSLHYHWEDEWSCMSDDDCPQCGARHMSPYQSDDADEPLVEPLDDHIGFGPPDEKVNLKPQMNTDSHG